MNLQQYTKPLISTVYKGNKDAVAQLEGILQALVKDALPFGKNLRVIVNYNKPTFTVEVHPSTNAYLASTYVLRLKYNETTEETEKDFLESIIAHFQK
ncbi:hypothetical protein [Vibrio harveyi]|uniref:hypothetical protein n=1 Tax=Vibrio harveyi TaxID=669 RepID=UPI0018F2422A|nr:hypothetical protein [Vibrio harveyi]